VPPYLLIEKERPPRRSLSDVRFWPKADMGLLHMSALEVSDIDNYSVGAIRSINVLHNRLHGMRYNARNDEIRDNVTRMTSRVATVRLFGSAFIAAMFVVPGATSGSNFTARADQPVKLAQNKCTPPHQRLCRQHHDECLKKSGSTQYGCCMSYSACLTRGFRPGLTCRK